ncbi:hypothetical protein Hdeb2414_s0140g00810491 [Helianthus debilis subsp. tardiflorus]
MCFYKQRIDRGVCMYEYSKLLLGNSHFTLLPFQPYKLLIYAYMLVEVSDSINNYESRAPEVETWRRMVRKIE